MNDHIEGTKAILFDLGNVIIDLHYDRSMDMLNEVGITEKQLGNSLVNGDLLKQFETGAIDEIEFRRSFCSDLGVELTNEAFDTIWNALLGEISQQRLSRLIALKKRYRTLILSNTNAIHEQCFNTMLSRSFGYAEMGDLVHQVYYSHQVGMRKPDASIYQYVLDQEGLSASEVFFIDDREDNVLAARALGIKSFINTHVDAWLRLPQLNLDGS